MFILELYFAAVEVDAGELFDDAGVVEEGGEWVDGGLDCFGIGLVGEVEFDGVLGAVGFISYHIYLLLIIIGCGIIE